MKKIGAILCLIVCISCKSSVNSQVKKHEISINQVKEDVEFLTSDELQGRNTGTNGIETAARYIENVFTKNNIKPYFETYRDTFNVKDIVGYNVVGLIEGNDPKLKNEFVIIGAHYDHIGFKTKVDNDSIANGANDNAAGTSAVLALAEYLAKEKMNKRSIIVALFSGEEMGLLGSKHLANKLKERNLNLYTMLNFEMIGVPFKDRDYEAFVTGYDLTNMAQIMNNYIGSNYIGRSEVAIKYNLFKQSDNYAFYQVFNVPCQTISSCDLSNYNYYHHVDDEADKLDYEHMTKLINKMIPAIEHICNSATKEIKMTHE
jgi:Zn-dependent M28 family amino/carboxypeptidase